MTCVARRYGMVCQELHSRCMNVECYHFLYEHPYDATCEEGCTIPVITDYLDFETDCGFPQCRAITHQVNHSFCRKHNRFFHMTPEERDMILLAKWSLNGKDDAEKDSN